MTWIQILNEMDLVPRRCRICSIHFEKLMMRLHPVAFEQRQEMFPHLGIRAAASRLPSTHRYLRSGSCETAVLDPGVKFELISNYHHQFAVSTEHLNTRKLA